MSLKLPLLLLDRYNLTEEIGRGGQAAVYRAKDQVLGRDVAVKLLREDAISDDIIARFQQEISITSQLVHAHILHVYDTGVHAGRPFVVMELASGNTLAQRMHTENQLGVADAMQIVREVGLALAHAHERGVVHRDVKPENILLGPGGAILADFGVARITQADLSQKITSTGTAVGTLLYMSPEQLCAEPNIDARSDQYSLACVLYEMLAGVRPHNAATFEGLRMLRMSGAYVSLRAHRPNTSAMVDDAVRTALAPLAADRFRNVEEFLAALGATTSSDFRTVGVAGNTPIGADIPVAQADEAIESGEHSIHSDKSTAINRWFRRRSSKIVLGVVAASVAGIISWRATPTADGSSGSWALPPGDASLVIAVDTAVGRSASDSLARLVGRAIRDEAGLWSGVRLDATVPRRDAVGVMLVPRINTAGDSIRVTVDLKNGAGTTVASVDRLTSRTALEQPRPLARELLIAALVKRADVTATLDSAPSILDLTTRDWMTLRMYTQAFRLERRGALVDAREMFDSAARKSPGFGAARYWGVQIRAWTDLRNADSWGNMVDDALRTGVRNKQDSLALAAIDKLRRNDFPKARAIYETLQFEDSSSFIAAYGIGQSLQRDRAVLKTSDSYAFRTSAQAVIRSYTTAIDNSPTAELLGALFGPILDATYARSGSQRQGISTTVPTVRFAAMPALNADTLAFTPLLASEAVKAPPPDTWALAVTRGSSLANKLTARFRTRWPHAPDSWFWRAAALELTQKITEVAGEVSAGQALDSAASANPSAVLRANIQRARVSIALRQGDIRKAVALARVPWTGTVNVNSQVRQILLPLAVFVNDHKTAEQLRVSEGSEQDVLPPELIDSIDAFALRAVMGCNPTLNDNRGRLERMIQSEPFLRSNKTARSTLVSDAYRNAVPCLGADLMKDIETGVPRDRAIRLLAENDRAGVLRILAQLQSERPGATPASITWDVIYLESWMLVKAGDSTEARRRLNEALDGIARMSYFTLDQAAQAAGLRKGIQLLADIAVNQGPTLGEKKWISAAKDFR